MLLPFVRQAGLVLLGRLVVSDAGVGGVLAALFGRRFGGGGGGHEDEGVRRVEFVLVMVSELGEGEGGGYVELVG